MSLKESDLMIQLQKHLRHLKVHVLHVEKDKAEEGTVVSCGFQIKIHW